MIKIKPNENSTKNDIKLFKKIENDFNVNHIENGKCCAHCRYYKLDNSEYFGMCEKIKGYYGPNISVCKQFKKGDING